MANRIKELLKRAGMTQDQLGERIGVHRTTINRLINEDKKGGIELTWDYAKQIAAVLRVRPEAIFTPLGDLRSVVVSSFAETGVWRADPEWSPPMRYVIAVPDREEWSHSELRGLECRDQSIAMRYPAGSILVYATEIGALEIGRAYVVDRVKGGKCERIIRIVKRAPDGTVWLVPESQDPKFEAFQIRTEGANEVLLRGAVVWSILNETAASARVAA